MMKLLRNLSIKNKLVLIVLLVSIPAIVIGFTFVIIQDVKIFKQDLVDVTKMTARTVGEFCSTALSFGPDFAGQVEEDLTNLLRTMPIVENGYIYDNKGKEFAAYNKAADTFSPVLPAGEQLIRFEGHFLHFYRHIRSGGKKYGAIYLRSSTTPLDKKINEYLLTMVLVGCGLIVLSYILATKLQKVISKPILKLAEVTGDISIRGDYSVRVQKTGNDEIGTLYEGFNVMLEQIQLREKERDEAEAQREKLFSELQEKNKELEQVIYVTSHDLRSPLVNIQGFSKELDFSLQDLACLLDLDTLPEEIKKKISLIIKEDIPDSLKYILTSTSKMDSLLTGLLKLSRVGKTGAKFSEIDMNNLMEEVHHAFEFHLKETGAKLKIADLPHCFGNEMQVNQVFSNLFNNALKYLDPERAGLIEISGCREDSHAVYCVEDNGLGIAPEHQAKVLEIFHSLKHADTAGEG